MRGESEPQRKVHSKNTRVIVIRKRVHWGQTPFRVNDDPEIGQLSADLTNNGVRLTQLWVIFLVKLTDLPVAKFFIPPQFRTPVRTHLHTANQRPRVLICIQPIHRGWFNPRYILVRTTLLLSNARGVVVKATCIALHCPACSRGVSSNPLAGFFFCYNKLGNNGIYSVRGDTQMMK